MGGLAVERHVVDVRHELEVRVYRLVPGDVLAGVGGHAAHQRGDLGLAGPSSLVVRLSWRMASKSKLPLDVVRIRSAWPYSQTAFSVDLLAG